MNQRDATRSGPELDATVSQDEIPKVYERLASVYDIWGRASESRSRDRAIELAAIDDGQAILEVAVGTGMLARAGSRMSTASEADYRLEVGTDFDLPAQSDSIDILVNNYMFDLIPYAEMDRVLDEFRRVLKINGRLIMVNMSRGESLASPLYDRIYRISPKAMGGCRGVRTVDRLRQHGFAVAAREYHQQLLFPSEVIVARKVAWDQQAPA